MKEALAELCQLLKEQDDLHQFELVFIQDGGASFEFGHSPLQDARDDLRRGKFKIGCLAKILISGAFVHFDRSKYNSFSLEAPINKYLSGNASRESKWDDSFEAVSMAQLLCHASGIDDFFVSLLESTEVSDREVVNQIFREGFIFPPSSRQSYCNLGYLLLVFAIERITGKRWLAFLNEFYGTDLQIAEGENDKTLQRSGSNASMKSQKHPRSKCAQMLSAVVGHNLYLSRSDMKLILGFLVSRMGDDDEQDDFHAMTESLACVNSNRVFNGHGWYKVRGNLHYQSIGSQKEKGTIIVDRKKKYALGFLGNGEGKRCNSLIISCLAKEEFDPRKFNIGPLPNNTKPWNFFLGNFKGNGYKFYIEHEEGLGLYARHTKINIPGISEPTALLQFSDFILVAKTNTVGWPYDSRQITYIQEADDSPPLFIRIGSTILARC
ncbi:MAG: beta-lactamase family protein [Azoarcus sp.]|jgi:hypothetical protein|nr:beta-lactamase family protein [Azoarcus sp.]